MAATARVVARSRSQYPNVLKIHNQLFLALFTREHKPSYASESVINDTSHTLYHRSMTRFLALPRDRLWVHVSTNLIPFTSVRRHYYRRKIEAALYDALRDAGFDLNAILWGGRRAQMRKRHEQNTSDTLQGGLTGTLELLAQKESVQAEWGMVQKHIGFIVEKLKGVSKTNAGRQVRKTGERESIGKPRVRG